MGLLDDAVLDLNQLSQLAEFGLLPRRHRHFAPAVQHEPLCGMCLAESKLDARRH